MSQTSRRSTQPAPDVQARLTGVADWDVQPAYTLVMADADTRPMTERETADAILRAAGGEITEGTAVYLDGALRFVTNEGDHLRQFLYAVRAPWQTDGVQTDFVHALRLVDGIYPAAAITPYRDLTAALRADDLLQVKAVRYETVTRERRLRPRPSRTRGWILANRDRTGRAERQRACHQRDHNRGGRGRQHPRSGCAACAGRRAGGHPPRHAG